MNTVIAAFVMVLGVVLIGWDLYCLYHGMPLSVAAFVAGAAFAYLGSKWLQGTSSNSAQM